MRLRSRIRLCVIGDALLDLDWDGDVRRVCNDAPVPVLETSREHARPGGAGLAAALAARSGARTTLITALSHDSSGRRLRDLLEEAGVEVVDLGMNAPTPIKLRLRASGHSLARVDRDCWPVAPPGRWNERAAVAIRRADAVLVSDYGRGVAGQVANTRNLMNTLTVWDPHTRGPRPPARTTLTTPNIDEAHALVGHDGPPCEHLSDLVDLSNELAQHLGCVTAMTAGALGALVADGHTPPVIVPTDPSSGDVCGAGDRFAVSVTLGLASGAPLLDAVTGAVNDASAFVAGNEPRPGHVHPPARPNTTGHNGDELAAVRRNGGTIVAAGGCFDVLHAGHVQLLDQARRLGDYLVVCLNSDSSVRRLKGPNRPLNTANDRAAVLRGLGSVDSVLVFNEDTPCRALESIQPDVFVKGADYEGVELVEEQVMSRWGGHVVLLPLAAGHSTTRILSDAAAAVGA